MPPYSATLFGKPETPAKDSIDPRGLPSIAAKAREIGENVVSFCDEASLLSPSLPPTIDVLIHDDVDLTVRKIVKQIVRDKQPLFRGMIESVRPSGFDEFRTVFSSVVRHLVAEGESDVKNLTWAKIVTAYAFGGLLAHAAVESVEGESYSKDAGLRELGRIVGDVILDHAGGWIQAQGGWDAFVQRFEIVNAEETITRKLIYFLGTAAALLVGLSLYKWKR